MSYERGKLQCNYVHLIEWGHVMPKAFGLCKLLAAALLSSATFLASPLLADELSMATWNIADLHHEVGVPLRPGSEARDQEDFDRLRKYVRDTLNSPDIIALQEVGSPEAAHKIFPEANYHIHMSGRYQPGMENLPASERDIFTAFAIRKKTFPTSPVVTSAPEISVMHIGFDRDGKPSARPTRWGVAIELDLNGKKIKLLNVHLKSVCHSGSLDPVRDTRKDGKASSRRYHCRTLQAQSVILESWIEQQAQQGYSVIVLGDFNRRLNKVYGTGAAPDHFWAEINDGTPDGLQLRKGPVGENTTCWVGHKKGFKREHIDFIVYDSTLDTWLKLSGVRKVALPDEGLARYAEKNAYKKLSDHCPVVATVKY